MPTIRTSALAVAATAALTLTVIPLVPASPAVPAATAATAVTMSTTAKADTTMRLDATPDTLGKGEKTRVQGDLFRTSTYAPMAGRKIRLQSRRAWTTRPWQTYATVTTDKYGRFHHYRLADRSRQYRALYSGSTVYQAATSNAAITKVTLGAPTRISAWVESTAGKATVRGSLRRSSDGKVLANQWVRIDRRKSGTLSWTKAGSRTTRSNGYYSFTDTKRTADCFIYRATYNGNSRFAGKSARTIYKTC
ncbi:hypothetical protein [Kribbia dieselivorans]|uniref:hypothetical protein n=1 Tax=Kribbia dieselivorans TaxID=331526 RepID=UPI000838E33F|nr:hypothetical protein [Kribbia dieselivorans]